MVKMQLAFAVLSLALAVFCLVGAISTPEPRHLPRWAWIVLILLFPLLGSLAWLFAGRTVAPRAAPGAAYPEYQRPGRMTAQDPVKDEEFLRQVRARAEEQRRRAAEQKRRAEE